MGCRHISPLLLPRAYHLCCSLHLWLAHGYPSARKVNIRKIRPMPPRAPHGVAHTKPNFPGSGSSVFKGVVTPNKSCKYFKLSLLSVVTEDALPPMGVSFVSSHFKSTLGYFGVSYEIIPLGSCFYCAY